MELSVIIVTFNSLKWLPKCFESLQKQKFRDFEIIVVDSDSSDDSVDYIKKNHKKIKLIENKSNLGFGASNNVGAKEAKGCQLLFLNADIKISDPDFLEKFLKGKKLSKFDLCNPRILDFNKKDPLKGDYIGMDIIGFPGPSKKLFYAEGCCLLIDKKLFEELSGFDEDYFMYSEDVDLSWRAQLLGKKLGICESVELIHYGGGASESTRKLKNESYKVPSFRRYEVEKNILSNLLKNYAFYNVLWAVPLFLILHFSEVALYFLLGKFWMGRRVSAAFFWNVKNIKKTLRKRKKIQSTRVISDKILLKRLDFKFNKIKALINVGEFPKYVK